MRLLVPQSHIDIAKSDCSEEDCSAYDFTARLDIRYKAFKDDIEYAERYYRKLNLQKKLTSPVPTHTVLSRSKHRIYEDWELKHRSTWRGNALQEDKIESSEKDRKRRLEESQTSFKEDRKKRHEESQTSWEKDRKMRYKVWLHIHERAIYALEGHFRRNSFSNNIDIRGMLRDLWCFLPQEFFRCGTDIELQKRHVKWITSRTTVLRRVEINEFLQGLVKNFCKRDNGALADRISLFECDSDIKSDEYDSFKKDMLASGAYAFLVERLLLQTPLLFWPAVFKPGVSKYFEENTKSAEVYYSPIGELVVQCGNTRWGGGYEVSVLWARLRQYEKSEDISRCSRAYEYRFSLNISPSGARPNWSRVDNLTDESEFPF
jgi:hypothetical protein